MFSCVGFSLAPGPRILHLGILSPLLISLLFVFVNFALCDGSPLVEGHVEVDGVVLIE